MKFGFSLGSKKISHCDNFDEKALLGK